ncbi:MAG: TfoX/Sxy family protein [Burkholderiales bacterium]|nr:TfoX/Sxy family protein [Burkholderiales bacterium]
MNTKLANLGPKSEAMLRRAGITTEEQLRSLGAARAYVMVKRCGVGASLNLLWALEGALTRRSWQAVAKTERLDLLLQVEALMAGDGRRPGSSSSRRTGSRTPRPIAAASRLSTKR